MKFEAFHLHKSILENISELGYRKPTDIQYKAIKPILFGDDVLAIAQTGTGKTAAFVIPTIEILIHRKREREGIRCIIMEPTHELALQTANVVDSLAKDTNVSCVAIYGGVEQDNQIEKLRNGVDIIVATPGRLFDLMSQGHLIVGNCEMLILDEADHMLDLGFIDDIRQLVKRLPRKRQTLFFSATINENIKKLAYSIVHKPVHIRISPKNMVSRNITHSVLRVEMNEKRFYLERIFRENEFSKIMVFVRTRVRAERILEAMQRVDIQAINIHGNKSQSDRNRAIEDFRKGRFRMLIATDISARGIDLPQVDYVVNYDVPDVVENYVHRVGRTGRGMDKGYAVTFCSTEETEQLQAIEDYLEEEIDEIEMEKIDREATLDFSRDSESNWKKLVNDQIKLEERLPRKKKAQPR